MINIIIIIANIIRRGSNISRWYLVLGTDCTGIPRILITLYTTAIHHTA